MVRTDLSFSQQAVQACHAAIEAARHALIPPAGEHPHLVLCGIGSEVELLNVFARLVRLDIAFRPFYEPDLGGELTALCTRPLRGDERLPLRRYRTLGPPKPARPQALPGDARTRGSASARGRGRLQLDITPFPSFDEDQP